MSEVKKVNAGKAITTVLAQTAKGCTIVKEKVTPLIEKNSDKISSVKASSGKAKETLEKVWSRSSIMSCSIWMAAGFALLFHGAHFKHLFLCVQVVLTFFYGRVTGSISALVNDFKAGASKKEDAPAEDDEPKADAKAEPKPEESGSKHAQKRAAKKEEASKPVSTEDGAAAAKNVLKIVDSSKVSTVCYDIVVAFMACHMVLEGGLARTVVVTYALVTNSKARIAEFLDFGAEHADITDFTDILLSFVLYSFFGGMAVIIPSLALALNVAMCGAQMLLENGLFVAEQKGKIPDGQKSAEFATSLKGVAAFGALTAIGTLWQFWSLMAGSDMAWYFKILYCAPYISEQIISIL